MMSNNTTEGEEKSISVDQFIYGVKPHKGHCIKSTSGNIVEEDVKKSFQNDFLLYSGTVIQRNNILTALLTNQEKTKVFFSRIKRGQFDEKNRIGYMNHSAVIPFKDLVKHPTILDIIQQTIDDYDKNTPNAPENLERIDIKIQSSENDFSNLTNYISIPTIEAIVCNFVFEKKKKIYLDLYQTTQEERNDLAKILYSFLIQFKMIPPISIVTNVSTVFNHDIIISSTPIGIKTDLKWWKFFSREKNNPFNPPDQLRNKIHDVLGV